MYKWEKLTNEKENDMENNKQILQTQQLTKKFGKRWAVRRLNLNVQRGDIYGFLGPNGAGKSTTIRMIIGLISPTNGKIFIDNEYYHPHFIHLRKKIRALIEKPSFYEYLSGLENLKILARFSGIKDINIIKNSLKKVKLYSRRNDKVGSYSQGMKQRLGIAQAIMGNPELIILDEPTTGLDPQGIREIREIIKTLNLYKNITFFISSHILKEVEDTCNRIGIINEGTLLAQGNIRNLLQGKSLEDYFISLTADREEKL